VTEQRTPPRRITIGDVLCAAGLVIGMVTSYTLIALSPRLLAHHAILLEALNGSTVAIVTGGAMVRVGRDPLFLVAVAPLITVVTYDVFFWWAGRRWGNSIAGFYTRNNPRAARWIARAERLVHKYGIWALMANYYLPIPNFVIFLACGTSGLPLWMFVLGDLIGLLAWEALLIGLGWGVGHPAVHVVDQISHYSTRVTIAVIAVIVIGSALRRRFDATRANRRSKTTGELG